MSAGIADRPFIPEEGDKAARHIKQGGRLTCPPPVVEAEILVILHGMVSDGEEIQRSCIDRVAVRVRDVAVLGTVQRDIRVPV